MTGWIGCIYASWCGLAFVPFVDEVLGNILLAFGAFLEPFLFVAAGR